MPLLPDEEGNGDAVRVIEVGARRPGAKERGDRFPPPCRLRFPPSSGHRGRARSRSSDACCPQALRSRGRPAGLARPRTGVPLSRTRT